MEEFESNPSELDFAILQSLHQHGQPVGSGTLHYVCKSGATI